jgi:serine/threonine protein kinase
MSYWCKVDSAWRVVYGVVAPISPLPYVPARRYKQWLSTEWAIGRTEGKELPLPSWFWPETLSRSSGQLLVRLLHHDPHMRLSAEDTLTQPWCRGVSSSSSDAATAAVASHNRLLFPSDASFGEHNAQRASEIRSVRTNSRGKAMHNGNTATLSRQRSGGRKGLEVCAQLPDAVSIGDDDDDTLASLAVSEVRRLSFESAVQPLETMARVGLTAPHPTAVDSCEAHCKAGSKKGKGSPREKENAKGGAAERAGESPRQGRWGVEEKTVMYI